MSLSLRWDNDPGNYEKNQDHHDHHNQLNNRESASHRKNSDPPRTLKIRDLRVLCCVIFTSHPWGWRPAAHRTRFKLQTNGRRDATPTNSDSPNPRPHQHIPFVLNLFGPNIDRPRLDVVHLPRWARDRCRPRPEMVPIEEPPDSASGPAPAGGPPPAQTEHLWGRHLPITDAENQEAHDGQA